MDWKCQSIVCTSTASQLNTGCLEEITGFLIIWTNVWSRIISQRYGSTVYCCSWFRGSHERAVIP